MSSAFFQIFKSLGSKSGREEFVPFTEYSIFRQRAVADGVRGLIWGDVVHRDADPLIDVLVVENMVSMAVKQIRDKTKQIYKKQVQLYTEILVLHVF